MTISARSSTDQTSLIISMPERFDFSCFNEFRSVYEKDHSKHPHYSLDMRNTAYLDSSALGMLLQLREFAGNNNTCVTIENTRTEVRKILEIANFGKMFTIR